MRPHPEVAAHWLAQVADSDDLGPLDFVTDDVVWHVLGRDEPYRGKAEMRRGSGAADYERVGEETHDVIANDEHARIVDARGHRVPRREDHQLPDH